MAKVTRLTLDNSGGLDKRRLHLREIAETDAPLDTVGQDLRKARTRKGEDLAQVAGILKIRKDYLEGLEESAFDRLPGRTYAIGFVRTYANYVGLDAVQCIERLKAEMAGRVDSKESGVQMSPADEERSLPRAWLVLAAVMLIAFAYGGYYFVTSANQNATRPTTAVPARLEAEAAAPAQQTATATPVAPASSASLPITAPASAPASPPAPAAAAPVPAPQAASSATPQAAAAAPGSLPEGQKYGLQNAGSRITLRIHREGRVDVKGPGDRVFLARILKPGDTYRVPNFPGVLLGAGDAGAVEVLVDGKSVGYAGQDGVAAMDLNAQDFLKRQPG